MIGPGDCCCDGLNCDVMLPDAAEILTAEWSLRFGGIGVLSGFNNSCTEFNGVWDGTNVSRPALGFFADFGDYVQYRASGVGPDIPGDTCSEISDGPPPDIGIILWIAKNPTGVSFLNGLLDTLHPGCRDRDIYAFISAVGIGTTDAIGSDSSVYYCVGDSGSAWHPCNQGGLYCCTDSGAGLTEVRRIA